MKVCSMLCCVAVLSVGLFAGTSEAKDKLKMMDTINSAPLCYVLSEFKSYYVKGWKDDLDTLYVNYSNAYHLLQSIAMKAEKMEKAKTETILTTSAIMFNKTATNKREILLDLVAKMQGDRIRIGSIISGTYDDAGCSQFSKFINIEKGYQVDDEITEIKRSKDIRP